MPDIVKRVSSGTLGGARVLSKPQNAIAVAIFAATVGRAIFHAGTEKKLIDDLLVAFDRDLSHRLNVSELSKLLGSNGVALQPAEVKALFGEVDHQNDGFDREELIEVVSAVRAMPKASQGLRAAANAGGNFLYDVAMVLLTGGGLLYMAWQSHVRNSRWAATAFKNAVRAKQMTSTCERLQKQAQDLSVEKCQLEEKINELGDSSPNAARMKELDRLQRELSSVSKREEEVRGKMGAEISELREEASKNMSQAERAFKKMERMMQCIKGLDAFSGVGMDQSPFREQGAQRGFAKVGVCMDTVTFGTMEDGKLHMFETSDRRKLGEGRNCAYLCNDVETGQEYALKKYTITNRHDREAALKDLFALRSQVGKHERVMDYERVIESEDRIWVLMEFIKGKDLYDTVCSTSHGLSEEAARPLFRDLVEAVQHLHRNNVIHCDLKPENAMVEGSTEDGTARLKLIDFGCSCFLQYQTEGLSVPFDPYTAPEHLGPSKRPPAVASDMWRLGCTLFVMLVRAPPFAADGETIAGMQHRRSDKFYRTTSFESLSTGAQDLISKLIVADHSKRLNTAAVLEHHWLQGK